MKIPGVEFTVSREFHDDTVARLQAQLQAVTQERDTLRQSDLFLVASDWRDKYVQLQARNRELEAEIVSHRGIFECDECHICRWHDAALKEKP